MLLIIQFSVKKALIIMHEVLYQMLFVKDVHIVFCFPLVSVMDVLVVRLRHLNGLVVERKNIEVNVIRVFHSVSCGDHPHTDL